MHNHNIFHHETNVQIRFNDVDMLGHINNATIQEYFDLGRMHYLGKLFEQGKLYDNNHALIIASICTDFHIPIYLTEKIKVQTKVIELGNKSLKMLQLIVDEAGEIKATSNSIMVCFKKENNASEVIPDKWREKFKTAEFGDLK
ncbi:MAG: acyl-CoA thioesterase [Marinilabiliaceae bacterium]|nr:acyl-CoA thioesterase [Marinilabiliaceae bacterium]